MTGLETVYGFVNLCSGIVAGALLLYLVTSETIVVTYDRFFNVLAVGLVAFAATGLSVGLLAESLVHAIHALAALVVAAGAFGLVRAELDREEAFEAVFRP